MHLTLGMPSPRSVASHRYHHAPRRHCRAGNIKGSPRQARTMHPQDVFLAKFDLRNYTTKVAVMPVSEVSSLLPKCLTDSSALVPKCRGSVLSESEVS